MIREEKDLVLIIPRESIIAKLFDNRKGATTSQSWSFLK